MTMSRSLAFKLAVPSILLLVLGMKTRDNVPALIAALQKDPVASFEAAHALGDLGAEARQAVPALMEMLRSDDHDRVEVATFVLARIAPDPAVRAAVPILTETLRSPDKGWVARFNAAVVLRKLGGQEEELFTVLRDGTSLSLMIPLLEGGKPLNRLHVCEALMLSGPPRRDFLDLFRKLAGEDPDARVRAAALEALRKVRAAEHAAKPDEAPKALPTLPPELAEPGQALIEIEKAVTPADVERMAGLRLLGGTREGDSATIDFFSAGGIFSHGSVLLVKEGGRWIRKSVSRYPGYTEPYIGESTPLELREAAALSLLKAVAAGQNYQWLASSTYTDSLAKLELPAQTPGYAISLTAGAKSNGIYHAWSAEAHPVGYPETGVHSYYLDERGILLQSDTRGLPLALEMPEH